MPTETRTSERLQTLERALEAAEERFTVLFRESADPVLLLSAQGDVLAVNQAFETLTGVSGATLFREETGWSDLLHEEDLPRLTNCFARPWGQGADMTTCELRVRRPWGEYVWYEWSLSGLHNETGEVRGLLAVARDIHSRVERESRLLAEARTIEQRHQRRHLYPAGKKNS